MYEHCYSGRHPAHALSRSQKTGQYGHARRCFPTNGRAARLPLPLPGQSRRFCYAHHTEYRELTAAYKEMSKNTERAAALVTVPLSRLNRIKTISQVTDAMRRVERWRGALAAEGQARDTHHTRFFRSRTFADTAPCCCRCADSDPTLLHRWMRGTRCGWGFLEEQHAFAETLLSELTLKRNRIVAPHEAEMEMGWSMRWMVDDEDDSPENAILGDWTVSHESAQISNRVDEERPEDSSTSLFARVSLSAHCLRSLCELIVLLMFSRSALSVEERSRFQIVSSNLS